MSFMPEHEQEWYDSVVKDRDTKTFAIVVREGQRVIGSISLMSIDNRGNGSELGIAIGDKSAWGQGYGREAVRVLCDYGFTFLGVHAVLVWDVALHERGTHAFFKVA